MSLDSRAQKAELVEDRDMGLPGWLETQFLVGRPMDALVVCKAKEESGLGVRGRRDGSMTARRRVILGRTFTTVPDGLALNV